MAPLLALVEFVVSVTVVVLVLQSLYARKLSAAGWMYATIIAVFGVILGVCLGFYFSYNPAPEVTLYSFPIPAGWKVLETYKDGSEQWVDFITPVPLMVAAANTCLIFSISIVVVWLSHWLVTRKSND